MRGKRYRIGIDVGLNSVGLAAVEVSDENSPVRLLNAQSVIHDGGVDPQKNKEAITRKNMSGVARRTRRMRRRKRERFHKLICSSANLDTPLLSRSPWISPLKNGM